MSASALKNVVGYGYTCNKYLSKGMVRMGLQ